jgi:hypothetical protein
VLLLVEAETPAVTACRRQTGGRIRTRDARWAGSGGATAGDWLRAAAGATLRAGMRAA